MTKIPEENLRNMSLERLRSLKNEKSVPVYAELIKRNLKGRDLTKLRDRLLSGKITDHSRECEYQESLIDFLKKDLQKVEKDIQDETAFIEKKRAERQEAYEEFLKAQDKLEKADKALEAAEIVMSDFQSNHDSISESISIAEQQRDAIDTVILVHRSANLGQLIDCKFGKVIVTSADAKFLKDLIIPDEVFDSNLAKGLIERLPYQFKKLPEDSLKSIIQFVEMAMYYYLLEDKKVIMLYANNDVATILKKEGVE